jgi:lysophospholipase L1-like esterase
MFVRGLGVAGAGRSLPLGTVAIGEGMRMAIFAPANAIDDIDATGPLSVAPGGQSRPAAPGPSLVLGRPPAGHLAVICTGDSIADGAGDNARLLTGKGFFNRAAINAQGLNAIASLNLTKFGSTAGTTTRGLGTPGAAGFAYRQALLGFGNVLVDQYGTNTLGTSTVTAASKVLDTARPLWTLARAAGIQKVIRTTLMPRTKSSNRFIDAAGQTPQLNWGPGGSRDAVNEGFAAALAAGQIDVLVDLLAVVSTAADRHRWITNGTVSYPTTDGVHPSSAMARLMAEPLRSAYLALTVD